MLLKRIYDHTDPKAPKLKHIEVKHTGVSAEQNFSRRLVEQGVAAGWMTLSKGKLVLHVKPEDLTYTIMRTPGHYCLHCGEVLTSDSLGEAARLHIAAKHADAKSPDAQWPHGYYVTHAYECALDIAQQEKFKARRMGEKKGS